MGRCRYRKRKWVAPLVGDTCSWCLARRKAAGPGNMDTEEDVGREWGPGTRIEKWRVHISWWFHGWWVCRAGGG